jgi:hypothetical protein
MLGDPRLDFRRRILQGAKLGIIPIRAIGEGDRDRGGGIAVHRMDRDGKAAEPYEDFAIVDGVLIAMRRRRRAI